MASALEDDLSCPVCCEVYQDPRLLPCGHSFCHGCLEKHWAVNRARTCPVCRRPSPKKLVANLVLRNTCESYLKEKEKEKEKEGKGGEVRCPQHGEEMRFYCETDGEVICSQCKIYNHGFHRVQPLAHAVRERKAHVRAAFYPGEDPGHNSATRHAEINRYIQHQAEQTERQIRKDFEQLYQFLREEEENRIATLREEKESKTETTGEGLEQPVRSHSYRVREVEDQEEESDMFLQSSVLQRSPYEVPDLDLDSEALIDVAKHLGNLKYRVWEKMKDLCPCYPVVLDPNKAHAGFSISDDLACVGKSRRKRRGAVTCRRNRIVLGSEGYTGGFHCWDVEVGDIQHWTIGVCDGTAAKRPVKQFSFRNGFWGLSREGDICKVLGSAGFCEELRRMPRTVRVKLGYHFMRRTVSFFNASDGSLIAGSIQVPADANLFPFLIPGEHGSVLRIQQDHVALTVKQKFGLLGRLMDVEEKAMIICIFFMAFAMIVGILSKK
ncbi:hypothetical protein NFI96_009274 [Prochilodus magdalenae]|nr:hypothetical protein NFI96_009274 [Prochilodus magdalenae]